MKDLKLHTPLNGDPFTRQMILMTLAEDRPYFGRRTTYRVIGITDNPEDRVLSGETLVASTVIVVPDISEKQLAETLLPSITESMDSIRSTRDLEIEALERKAAECLKVIHDKEAA